jgi:hypothetical protein
MRNETVSHESAESIEIGPIKPTACQFEGDDTCRTADFEVRGYAPALDMCRRLLAEGFDPATPLEVYRGDVLCLRISSIGYGAGLCVRDSLIGRPMFARRPRRLCAEPEGAARETIPADAVRDGQPSRGRGTRFGLSGRERTSFPVSACKSAPVARGGAEKRTPGGIFR